MNAVFRLLDRHFWLAWAIPILIGVLALLPAVLWLLPVVLYGWALSEAE